MRFTKRTIGFLLVILLLLPQPAFAALSDIRGHWAAVNIDYATDAGYVSGYEDGSFRPQGTVTRAEMVNFATRFFELDTLTPVATSGYSDVSASLWYNQAVRQAETADILKVFPGKTFDGDRPITRQETAALLYACLQRGPLPATPDMPPTFTDLADIAPDCFEGVAYLNHAGLLAGYPDGSFGPTRELTRAEALSLLLRTTDQEQVVADPAKAIVETTATVPI